ncbi:penicillin acylase family protein [Lacimicrobium sp. SS2-24]|uniref:penicillin acylase family protein n=1 Tax=Lacimicrobium sp. SS2-24 TaxID=2005569 RepID=UPI000B4B6E03|nr:penicillin acylase family protein [Lacimicrobium sp. SS2-24]
MKKWILIVIAFVAAALAAAQWLNQVNDYKTNGELRLEILDAGVTVTRDERGIAHIAASNKRDMLRAQGFITAQDRLFQMEFFKMLAKGRLSELIGEAGLASDKKMRVIGLWHNARKMAAQFSPEVKQFVGDYLDGVNAYIATQEREFPIELSLMGHTPKPWTLADTAVLLQYISLQQSKNMKAEAVAQSLIDTVGAERAATLLSINVNPDRTPAALSVKLPKNNFDNEVTLTKRISPVTPLTMHDFLAPIEVGSNNWVVGPTRSASGAAIVVNDPHLDARLLPGVWYPISMSTPDFHASGAALPGLGGMVIGRTDRVAFGVTNAYGDVQDLFIERIATDSDAHYLEGNQRIPFNSREEVIRIKDEDADSGFREEIITVRSTHRGPVVSDHGIIDLGDRVVTLRWGAAVAFDRDIGFDKLLFARSASEVRDAVKSIDIHMFNFVFADVDGNFGRLASGKIPIRRFGAGALPVPVTDSKPHWYRWIPKDDMPGEFNPDRGWTGTANNDTRPTNYPYTYSTYFSPSYRYDRMIELMDGKQSINADDHWRFMHDVKNLHAKRIVPMLIPLLKEAEYKEFAETLTNWDYMDTTTSRATLLFQTLYQELALATYEDDLGEVLTADMLNLWYFWQERFDHLLVSEPHSIWFDNHATKNTVENLADVVIAAAKATEQRLKQYDDNAVWGDVHRVKFVSPMRRSGFGSRWVGGGDYPMSGSSDTIRRARYDFDQPFDTAFFASYNLVSDMAEQQAILTALPGGVAARIFHQHYDSEIPAWISEQASSTPITREAAQASATSKLQLLPSE